MYATNEAPRLALVRASQVAELHLVRRPGVDLSHGPAAAITGLGSTMHKLYSTLGSAADKHANRAAHSLGLGPNAVAEKIRAFFGDGNERDSKLRELAHQRSPKLEKDCTRLMQYALPSESSRTQLYTFKSLTGLTTQYPGLRRIFLASLWDRPRDDCSVEWDFYRKFAAACICDEDVCLIVENSPPYGLGLVEDDERGLTVVERLLVAAETQGILEYSNRIAIRYLGGILGSTPFWLRTGPIHQIVVQKVLVGTKNVLLDLGLDCRDVEVPLFNVESDPEGIDILCQALIYGIQSCMSRVSPKGLISEYWYQGFWQVLQILRQPLTEGVLPTAWSQATTEEMNEIIPASYEPEVIATSLATVRVTQEEDQTPRLQATYNSPGTTTPLGRTAPGNFRVLPLFTTDLPQTTVITTSASFRHDNKMRRVLIVILYIDPGNGQGWQVEKTFADVLSLDERMQNGLRRVGLILPGLPISPIWKDAAPNTADNRRSILNGYWNNLLALDLPTDLKTILVTFLTTDVPRDNGNDSPEHKEGFLSKRGSRFGGWKLRYFSLDGSLLSYYDTRGGKHLGSIVVTGGQIGKGQQGGDATGGGGYSHAFLIIEAERRNSRNPRHILWAESEEERDSWVAFLSAAVAR